MFVYLQKLLHCLIIYSYKTNPSFHRVHEICDQSDLAILRYIVLSVICQKHVISFKETCIMDTEKHVKKEKKIRMIFTTHIFKLLIILKFKMFYSPHGGLKWKKRSHTNQ